MGSTNASNHMIIIYQFFSQIIDHVNPIGNKIIKRLNQSIDCNTNKPIKKSSADQQIYIIIQLFKGRIAWKANLLHFIILILANNRWLTLGIEETRDWYVNRLQKINTCQLRKHFDSSLPSHMWVSISPV